ncbi:hypothetical protein AMAG_03667 [Allomyces macrogynus ATCC 38327]|uniref:Neurochondrin n=1 Tax=Allomyces macrogynus (strain ATCC 38327) TaxID=578462 RepID=A0A0L0SA72_ALLM3|nr:hypothetical protein AMAG_03667 [Allomyces macrogynus ATCC 38327]|eukprot:KNE59381.1 hypothetical protein AMAG_03667 [Allomyces macrogynus ATCC 38327]
MVTLDQILPLLGPTASNEEKIAGLFALPNVVGPNDTEALRRVFTALDFEYLRKLLRAKGTDDCHVYHEVALNVLVAFAADETLAGTDQFRKCIKTIIKLLATPSSPQVLQDSVDLLRRLVLHPVLAKLIVKGANGKVLGQVYAANHDSELLRTSLQALIDVAVLQASVPLADVVPLLTDLAAFLTSPRGDDRRTDLLPDLDLLSSLLSYLDPPSSSISTLAPTTALVDLQPLLTSLLRTKGASPHLTHCTLTLASSWLAAEPTHGACVRDPSAWTVLATSAAIDIQVHLDTLDALAPVPIPDSTAATALGTSCHVVETLVDAIAREIITLPPRDLASWRRTCGDLVTALGAFLAQIAVRMPQEPDLRVTVGLLAVVRVACMLLAESDEREVAATTYGVGPLLVRLLEREEGVPVPVAPFVAPCLARVTADLDVARACVREWGGYAAVVRELEREQWWAQGDWTVVTHLASVVLNVVLLGAHVPELAGEKDESSKIGNSSSRATPAAADTTTIDLAADAVRILPRVSLARLTNALTDPVEQVGAAQAFGTTLVYIVAAMRHGRFTGKPVDAAQTAAAVLETAIAYSAFVAVAADVIWSEVGELVHLVDAGVAD